MVNPGLPTRIYSKGGVDVSSGTFMNNLNLIDKDSNINQYYTEKYFRITRAVI